MSESTRVVSFFYSIRRRRGVERDGGARTTGARGRRDNDGVVFFCVRAFVRIEPRVCYVRERRRKIDGVSV